MGPKAQISSWNKYTALYVQRGAAGEASGRLRQGFSGVAAQMPPPPLQPALANPLQTEFDEHCGDICAAYKNSKHAVKALMDAVKPMLRQLAVGASPGWHIQLHLGAPCCGSSLTMAAGLLGFSFLVPSSQMFCASCSRRKLYPRPAGPNRKTDCLRSPLHIAHRISHCSPKC